MTFRRFSLIALGLGLALPAVAQTAFNGFERPVNRPATPAGDSLRLYNEPRDDSRGLRISKFRQLYIRSVVDSTWYRALYGGTQFYVKRDAVTLQAAAAGAKAGVKAAPKPKRR
jgi:hypothetical protein